MKGKKVDSEFISEFIHKCITEFGKKTSDEILEHAKTTIKLYDEDIKMVEQKKIIRSKLLDVVAAFEKQNKDKTSEAKLLDFFKISNHNISKKICDQIKIAPIRKYELNVNDMFIVKQLLEYKILIRQNDNIDRGEKFDEYINFVLREKLCH